MPHMLVTILQILQTGLNSTCTTEACRRAADTMIQNRNIHQDHCYDFYEYACGNYRNTHPLISSGEYRGVYVEQNKRLNEKIAELLSIQDDAALPAVQTVRMAYWTCVTSNPQRTAPIDCVQPMKQQYPRVLIYLLATPEVYALREKIRRMTAQIKLTFINTIQNSWMDNNSKATAISQLNGLTLIVGFTPQMIEPENLLTPYLSPYRLFDVSCRFNQADNALFIPIADFFYPAYQLGLEVMHFAMLGLSVAHEMSHSFGTIGRRLGNWWSAHAQNVFTQKSDCFRQQYNQFPFLGQQIGQLTLQENVADNVGFELAFESYRAYRRFRGTEKKLVRFETYNHEKLFMLAFANKWCENVTVQMHINDVRSTHAPAPFRVNGMLMNSRDFGNLWNCPVNSRMNPEHKCSIFGNANGNH